VASSFNIQDKISADYPFFCCYRKCQVLRKNL